MRPDDRCPIDGEPYTFYERPGRSPERRCLRCRRNAHTTRHNGTERCYAGHVKTPWTWRQYGGKFRCSTCTNARRRLQRLTQGARLAA